MPVVFRCRRRSRGQALVEFALVVPLMLLILLATVDFGRLFFSYIQVTNAAREAANYAGAHLSDRPFDLTKYGQGVDLAAVGETNAQGQRGEAGSVQVGSPVCQQAVLPAPPPTPAPILVTCDASAADFATGLGNQVSVTVTQPFTFFTPIISGFFGVLPLKASATAPVLNSPVAAAAQPTPTPTPVPGSLLITKDLAGDLTGFNGGNFTFDVSCNGTAYGPVTIDVASGSSTANHLVTGIPAGAVCTVTETAQANAGAHGSWDTPPGADPVTIATNTQASVSITNTRAYNPPGSTPTPIPTPTPVPTPCATPSVALTPPSTTQNKQVLTVTFTGTSTGTPTSWTWDFGDGIPPVTAGSTQSHKFTYTLGPKGSGAQLWTVTLTTTGACAGSATATVTLDWR